MKSIVIGIHLHEEDVRPAAEAMRAGELYASVFPVDDDRPIGDRNLLLEVAAVRARLLDRATFVAIRYGVAVRDANELATKVAGMTSRWRELLIAHRDEVEMTLKVPAAAAPARPNRRDFASGAAYLRALHESSNAVDIDAAFRRDVERTLIPLASKHRWIRDASSVELAMLVPRADVAKINAAGEALRRDHNKTPFLLSGPWPLEVFTDDHQQ
jgi:gas vesicle protein GvpL/GvpF